MRLLLLCLRLNLGLLMLVALAAPAYAVDGVIEINQASAMAGNVTPGDTAGFPVTISKAGSYRLTGNLDLAAAATPSTALAINAIVNEVQIDLNGFSIIGPVTCTGEPATCPASDINAGGIKGTSNLVVTNGSIRGTGGDGISAGERLRIQHVTLVNNSGQGVGGGDYSTVTGSTAQANGSIGISCSRGCSIIENISAGNHGTGIDISGQCTITGNTIRINGSSGLASTGGGSSTILGNTVAFNTGFGLALRNDGYASNVITSNSGGTVTGGVQIGTNLCNGTTVCP